MYAISSYFNLDYYCDIPHRCINDVRVSPAIYRTLGYDRRDR